MQGDISKFSIKTAHVSIDNLLTIEMTRATQSMAWLEDAYHIYGCAVGTAGSIRPQWDGFDRQIAGGNVLEGNASAANSNAGGTVALSDFDDLIDTVRTKTAAPLPADDFFIVLSEPMLSELGRLLAVNQRFLTPVMLKPRRDTGIVGSPVTTADGGVEVPSYRGVPLVASSLITPQSATYPGTPAAALNAVSNASAFAASTSRQYRIEACDQYGITVASSNFATGSLNDANHGVDITGFAPTVTDAFGVAPPIHSYRVYLRVGGTTGHTLYGIVSAYDQLDNLVDTIRDNGQNIVGSGKAAGRIVGFNATALVANGVGGQYVGVTDASAGDGVNRVYTAPASGYIERAYLVSRHPDYIRVPTVTELESMILAPVNARSVQYACIADLSLAMRTGAFAAVKQGLKTV